MTDSIKKKFDNKILIVVLLVLIIVIGLGLRIIPPAFKHGAVSVERFYDRPEAEIKKRDLNAAEEERLFEILSLKDIKFTQPLKTDVADGWCIYFSDNQWLLISDKLSSRGGYVVYHGHSTFERNGFLSEEKWSELTEFLKAL